MFKLDNKFFVDEYNFNMLKYYSFISVLTPSIGTDNKTSSMKLFVINETELF